MNIKKKRDKEAELEKTLILNPEEIEKQRKQKKHKIVLTLICSILLIFTIMICSYQVVRAIGKSNLMKQAETPEPMLEQLEEVIAPETATDTEVQWQEGWIQYKGDVYAYNEDIMTFLFMGIDKNTDAVEVEEGTNGGQADALFLAVMNPHNKTIQVIGINRNTMTDIDVYNEQGAYVTTTKAQIAAQHGFGNGLEKSCEYQVKAVSNLFYQLPIHGYAAINMSAIATINDAVGGVDVTVLEDLSKRDASLVKGNQVHLEGKTAFWYVKYRNTDIFGSADMRLNRQKQYLNEFITAAKAATKKDISVPLDLYQAVSPMMTTNISLDEVAYLAPILSDYEFDTENFHMMEGETVMGKQFEEFYTDEAALYDTIIHVFYEKVDMTK